MADVADLRREIRLLCAEAQGWSRHFLKHIALLQQAERSFLAKPRSRASVEGLSSRWRSGRAPAAEALAFEPGEPESLFLERVQCFHALQLLRLHHDSLAALREARRQGPPPPATLRDILIDIEERYEWVSRTTMTAMLDLFLREQQVPAYAVLNVGTSLHLDDIDVGAIAAMESEALNRALSSLAAEMLRRASRLHFYLAEELGTDTYYATVERYRAWLDQGAHNYVAVSELLNARLVCGDRKLFEEFKKKVGRRFYYALGREADHYAYVRGILTEVRGFFRHEEEPFSINFKLDAIRAVRALISAEATRYNIRASTVWQTFEALRSSGDRLREVYQGLEEALTFFEIFRYVYQLLVVQQERVALSDEEVLGALDPIGALLGYDPIRQIRSGNRLLLEYNAALIRSRRLLQTLLDQQRTYVRALYVFGKIARGGQFLSSLADVRGNVGREFLEVIRSFRGTTFWQDILRLITNIDRDSLRRFADDIFRLEDAPAVIERYVRLIAEDTSSLLRVLLVIGEHRDYDRISRLFWMFIEAWLGRLRRKVSERESLLAAYQQDPQPFLRLLQSLDQSHQEALRHTLSRPVLRRELLPARRRLLHLLATFTRCSRFFERTLRRAVQHHPQVLEHLDDGRRFNATARWLLARALRGDGLPAALEDARSYYEIQFVRLGIEIMAGQRIPVLLREFRRMSERTVETLADLCYRQLQGREARQDALAGEPPLAILATGGNAREEGYLADYDAIVLSRGDRASVQTSHGVAAHLNAELTRLGVLPHHLFAEHFGRYAVTVPELQRFMRENRGRDFVERSEILGHRFVYGNQALYRRFLKEVVQEEVLARRDIYLRAMLEDEAARRREAPKSIERIQLKSDPGSLKEIHLTLDLLRARFGIVEAIPRRLFPKLVGLDPAHRDEYFTLLRTLNFLLRLRVLYQLTVGHESTIDPAQMQHTLALLPGRTPIRGDAASALLERYRARTARAAHATARLNEWMRAELEGPRPRTDVDSPPPLPIL